MPSQTVLPLNPAEHPKIAAIIVQQGKTLDFVDGVTQREETPEEYVRQEIAKSLVREYGYLKRDIAVEFTLRVGSRKPRADLIIFYEEKDHKNLSQNGRAGSSWCQRRHAIRQRTHPEGMAGRQFLAPHDSGPLRDGQARQSRHFRHMAFIHQSKPCPLLEFRHRRFQFAPQLRVPDLPGEIVYLCHIAVTSIRKFSFPAPAYGRSVIPLEGRDQNLSPGWMNFSQ